MGQAWPPDPDQRPKAPSAKPPRAQAQARAAKRQATSGKPQYKHIHLISDIMKDKIKEMKLEIERLKKLPDYEYVILDIQKEIECLKKKRKK